MRKDEEYPQIHVKIMLPKAEPTSKILYYEQSNNRIILEQI